MKNKIKHVRRKTDSSFLSYKKNLFKRIKRKNKKILISKNAPYKLKLRATPQKGKMVVRRIKKRPVTPIKPNWRKNKRHRSRRSNKSIAS
jgi:Icc-related predicted phosphoesterase